MHDTATDAGSYFERIDAYRFQPTVHTGGGWDPGELHFSPLGGLIVHAIEHHLAGRAETGMLLGRISFDILGRLATDVCEVRVETIRPGRTIELIEATLLIRDRVAIRARAWLLTAIDTSAIAGGGADPLPSPEALASWALSSVWPGGYIASLDVRPIDPPQPGRTTAWVSSRIDLVAGEATSRLASYVALVDTANGIAARQAPERWMFPNLDLTIHLHRQPEGSWVGLDTTVVFGPTGQATTSTVLHDLNGAIGQAQQILTVRPRQATG
jgi:Acyl-CoA thioesterase C-terminal domain/Acyl-CoA thioesterase N-terminal domain